MTAEAPAGGQDPLDALYATTQTDVGRARAFVVRRTFAADFALEAPTLNGLGDRLAMGASALGFVGMDTALRNPERARPLPLWRQAFDPAYQLRRPLVGGATPDLEALLDLAVDGILAHRAPELRVVLRDLPLEQVLANENLRWDDYVSAEVSRALVLIVRKKGSFDDLRRANEIVGRLRGRQREQEGAAFRGAHAPDTPQAVAARVARLVALYNLARVAEITATYLLSGRVAGPGGRALAVRGVLDEIDRFALSARDALAGFADPLRKRVPRTAAACKELVTASIFAVAVPGSVRQLLARVADPTRPHPTIELWFGQREALNMRLLDLTRSAVVLSLPTSAGKTLLAEMAIQQALVDAPGSRVVYIAPTRALVNQVCNTLRRDLTGYKVRIASPTFELGPVEDAVLQGEMDVLVTTPEKLDLLIRTNHPATEGLSLVVVDEAHNLSDPSRGARLELLLATLRRERAGLRFLLMTPFAQNAGALASWLGGADGTPILIDWRPNDRVVGALTPGATRRGSATRSLRFTTLNSVRSDCPAGEVIEFGAVPKDTKSQQKLAIEAAKAWTEVRDGAVLLLTSTRSDAEERAKSIADTRQPLRDARLNDIVARYVRAESGGDHPLAHLLARGVAFHHAGLSSESRYLIERLVEEGGIGVVAATSTLAQGVHFPISVAIVESLSRPVRRHGRWYREPMRPAEFWNLAGRAGRTLVDPLGTIAFACARKEQIEGIESFLQLDSDTVTSVLFDTLRALGSGQAVEFTVGMIERFPAASAFLQYIVHALSVAGVATLRGDLEAVLRSSFVYQQAQRESPELADTLIRIARSYVDHLEARKGEGLGAFAKLADGTGFSSPSIDQVWAMWRGRAAEAVPPAEWSPTTLFPADGSASPLLTRVIDTLHVVPEVHLGSEEGGEFSAERIARIASKWVSGVPIQDIAAQEYDGDLLHCTHHLYGTITSLLPWGLRAIERVSLAGAAEGAAPDAELLPAMVVHGVRSQEALALRMVGVPRIAAEGLATAWRAGAVDYAEVDSWLGTTTDAAWHAALPRGAPISGAECRRVWEVIDGRRAFRDL